MSHSFRLTLGKPPDLAGALAELPVDDVVIEEGLPESGAWPEGVWLHGMRPGVSCRELELGFDGEALHLRLFTGSSATDVLLALTLVQVLAARHGVPVLDAHGDEVSADAMEAHYDGFADAYAAWGARCVADAVAQSSGQAVTLPGPGRPFVVGRRLLAALRSETDGFVERFHERQQQVRWYDLEGAWHHAVAMGLQRDDGFPVRLAALGPGVRYLMPDVDGFALHAGDEHPPLFLPAEQLMQLVDVEWLDERQFLLEAIPADAWWDFLDAAAPRCGRIEDLG